MPFAQGPHHLRTHHNDAAETMKHFTELTVSAAVIWPLWHCQTFERRTVGAAQWISIQNRRNKSLRSGILENLDDD